MRGPDPLLAFFFVIAPLWVALVGVILALPFSYEVLFRCAYAATVSGDGTIRFRSLLRRRTTKANDAQSIFLRSWTWGQLPQKANGQGRIRRRQRLAFAIR